MPLAQETKPTPSPPLHPVSYSVPKSEKTPHRLKMAPPSGQRSQQPAQRKEQKSTSLKDRKSTKEANADPKRTKSERRRKGPSVPPTVLPTAPTEASAELAAPDSSLPTSDRFLPRLWQYSGSPFHEQLRDEYLKLWLPWRLWMAEYPPNMFLTNPLFLPCRVMASDWVEQMFESWYVAGYGYPDTRKNFEYAGMESD